MTDISILERYISLIPVGDISTGFDKPEYDEKIFIFHFIGPALDANKKLLYEKEFLKCQ
jgi:hypothetical protein